MWDTVVLTCSVSVAGNGGGEGLTLTLNSTVSNVSTSSVDVSFYRITKAVINVTFKPICLLSLLHSFAVVMFWI